MAASKGMSEQLEPVQLGAGTSRGAQCIGIALQAAIYKDAESVDVALDSANAFNSLRREVELE